MAATHPGRFQKHARRPYWRDPSLLGKTYFDRQEEVILEIGRDVWTRKEAVEKLKLGNSASAINLTKIARRLQVESLEQLIARFTMEDLFLLQGFGISTMVALMSAQESRQRDPIVWIDKTPEDMVTLGTFKHRALKQLHADTPPPPPKRPRRTPLKSTTS